LAAPLPAAAMTPGPAAVLTLADGPAAATALAGPPAGFAVPDKAAAPGLGPDRGWVWADAGASVPSAETDSGGASVSSPLSGCDGAAPAADARLAVDSVGTGVLDMLGAAVFGGGAVGTVIAGAR